MGQTLQKFKKGELDFLPNCLLCGKDPGHFKPFSEKGGYQIVRCRGCGLVFVNPRDSEDVILQQYRENQTSPIAYYQATRSVDSMNFGSLLDAVQNVLPRGRLLDIGCNVGTFLEAARGRGWSGEGVETNRKAHAICLQKSLPVTLGTFGKDLPPNLGETPFDWVAMNDTIEHFPDPRAALQKAARILRAGGILSILTPNLKSVLGRVFQIKPKEHLFYFEPDTLLRMLVETGFKVVRLEEWPRPRNVGAMHLGATFENPLWAAVSRFLSMSRLDAPVNLFLRTCFKEQIFALAEKAAV